MSNLMVYPAEIAEMSVNQLAALPHAKLLEATTNLDELLKWAKENRQKLDAAMELLRNAPGVTLFEDDADYPTPVRDATGQDDVMVGRVRQDISHPSGINMWIVADNVRKGAATNSVQIAELLVRDYL